MNAYAVDQEPSGPAAQTESVDELRAVGVQGPQALPAHTGSSCGRRATQPLLPRLRRDKEVRQILDLYALIYEHLLAVPVTKVWSPGPIHTACPFPSSAGAPQKSDSSSSQRVHKGEVSWMQVAIAAGFAIPGAYSIVGCEGTIHEHLLTVPVTKVWPLGPHLDRIALWHELLTGTTWSTQ